MRVVVLAGDEGGCGHYRMIWPGEAITKVRPDWQVEVHRAGNVKLGIDYQGNLVQLSGVDMLQDADILVLQRVGTRALLQLVEWAQARGITVVVDSDDAMWCIHPDNVSWRAWNQAGPMNAHWRILDQAMERADLVTVTTDRLAKRYGAHGRVEVLPNCVPDFIFDAIDKRKHFPDTPTIGWTGFAASHPAADLNVVGYAVQSAVRANQALVRVVGDGEHASRVWGVPVSTIPPQVLGLDYFSALSACDVAVVPLEDSTFNHGKSFLKALEYSAMGVPVVCSDTPAHRQLFKSGVPLKIVTGAEEWTKALNTLLTDDNLREKLGAQAREVVREKWTYNDNAEAWAKAWERAHARRARVNA